MLNAFRKIFTAPSFPEDEDKTRSAFVLTVIGWVILAASVTYLLLRNVPEAEPLDTINSSFAVLILVTVMALFISHRGYVHAASLVLTTIAWLGLAFLAWSAEGIRDVTFFASFLPILMAGLLLGWQWSVGFTVLSILTAWALAYAETAGLIVPQSDTPLNFAFDMTMVFAVGAAFIYQMISTLRNALDASLSTTHKLSESNKELSKLRDELEQHVEERTSELKKRAAQIEAVASVARAIASIQDVDTLLPTIVQLISQQFGFYHVAIFLVDENREKAILRAASSEGGLRMLSQQFNLPLDDHSIVGFSISRGIPRIALDVGTDSVYLTNPELPKTRSEMGLPLRISGRIIGALDVQSAQVSAFGEGDIGVLTTLADQVAIAIENARLFGEAKNALQEARTTFEKYTQQEWSTFARQVKQTGFIFDGKQVLPLENPAKREAVRAVAQTGSLSLEKETASIGIPIKLRGQIIGVLDVRSKRGARQWKQDEISILEAAAERAALALENARLVESAQRRAARERAIGDISTRIGAVSNLESILQTAVEELGRRIGGATEVALEITSEDGNNER